MLLEHWKALSERINGLIQNGLRIQQGFGMDAFGGLYAQIRNQCSKVFDGLASFRDTFESSLPQSAIEAINDCREQRNLLEPLSSSTPQLRHQMILAALHSLDTFRTEMTFILNEVELTMRSRAERAFAHLRRLIVVDPVARKRWQDAKNERACEMLGAVHLLWHGIFAFKVDAGARTDLVFPNKPIDEHDVQRYADGLVLTEWKVAHSEAEAKKRFAQARAQVGLYAKDPLAGIELTTTRYMVVVSRQQYEEPADHQEGSITYRHINIATVPEMPSKASRRIGRLASG